MNSVKIYLQFTLYNSTLAIFSLYLAIYLQTHNLLTVSYYALLNNKLRLASRAIRDLLLHVVY